MVSVQVNELLSELLEVLQLMLESGAEVYRVEESAQRICSAYGIGRTDVYATTSNIIVTIEVRPGEIMTHTRRISRISTDIERLDRLNALVRWVTETQPDIEAIRQRLRQIDNTPTYSTWVTLAFYGLIAGAFCFFFGSRSFSEFAVSTVIGIIVGCLTLLLGKASTNKLLDRFLCSLFACCCAFACQHTGIISSVDYVIIGNIMTLIPGIGLTNALRDLFTGDSISGILRMIEAVLLALAIACGYIVTTVLFGGAV